jgi:hypothetical protein
MKFEFVQVSGQTLAAKKYAMGGCVAHSQKSIGEKNGREQYPPK